ncbi:MAG TPA: hypothetical protein VFX70_04250 [Mycobacteriales bacterium]|nr:hypothetical protein [Mycobacteriales bacterium]
MGLEWADHHADFDQWTDQFNEDGTAADERQGGAELPWWWWGAVALAWPWTLPVPGSDTE